VRVLDPSWVGRSHSLFVCPQADDVVLGCPARLLSEAQSGRRTLVLALFGAAGVETSASEVLRELGADYAAGGLPSARERGSKPPSYAQGSLRSPEDEEVALAAARLLTDAVPRIQPKHVYAPLGLGRSLDHQLAYEAALRAFANEAGRNLFLYEERPEAFVPGAVRTRLALLGVRLAPGAAKLAEGAGVLRHVWRSAESERLRGERAGIGARFSARVETWRRHRLAAPWNPLRALGPRLHPVVHRADEGAREHAQAAAERLLPVDPKGRRRAAQRWSARASALAKELGGAPHAERLWLFLPSHDGLPEIQHPLEAG
jgi:hypothetical protein